MVPLDELVFRTEIGLLRYEIKHVNRHGPEANAVQVLSALGHMNEYVRTDTAEDLAATLELALVFLEHARADDRYWKWVVHAIHSSAQSTAALALEGSNGFLVQKPGTMKRMLEAHATGAPPVEPRMDNFVRLINKSLVKANLRPSAQAFQDNGHIAALNSLDELRDGFAHFNIQSWSIETLHILECVKLVLEYVHHYVCTTPAIRWHDEANHLRTQTAIVLLRGSIGPLCTAHKTA